MKGSFAECRTSAGTAICPTTVRCRSPVIVIVTASESAIIGRYFVVEFAHGCGLPRSRLGSSAPETGAPCGASSAAAPTRNKFRKSGSELVQSIGRHRQIERGQHAATAAKLRRRLRSPTHPPASAPDCRPWKSQPAPDARRHRADHIPGHRRNVARTGPNGRAPALALRPAAVRWL